MEVYRIKTRIDRNRTHLNKSTRNGEHKKRLGMVSTEPKGQKLKISELIFKLIQNNVCNINTFVSSAKPIFNLYVSFLHYAPSLSVYTCF